MTIFRYNIIAAAFLSLVVNASAQPSQEGTWSLTFSPSENLHKLVFTDGDEGGVYFRCKPASGVINMMHNIEGVDVRAYVPKVEWGGIRVTAPYKIEWEDYGGGVYYVDMTFAADNKFIKLLPYAIYIQIDSSRYPIDEQDEFTMIREFLRVCAP